MCGVPTHLLYIPILAFLHKRIYTAVDYNLLTILANCSGGQQVD